MRYGDHPTVEIVEATRLLQDIQRATQAVRQARGHLSDVQSRIAVEAAGSAVQAAEQHSTEAYDAWRTWASQHRPVLEQPVDLASPRDEEAVWAAYATHVLNG